MTAPQQCSTTAMPNVCGHHCTPDSKLIAMTWSRPQYIGAR